MTQHEEIKLLQKYHSFILGIASKYVSHLTDSVYGLDDLYAETVLAVLVEARKLDDPYQVILKRFEIQNAVMAFVVRNYAITVPYGSIYYVENARGKYQNAMSLNEMVECGKAYEITYDPMEDTLTDLSEYFIMEKMTPTHRSVLKLLKDGYSRKEIADMLGITTRQARRRIEEIQDAFFEELAPW